MRKLSILLMSLSLGCLSMGPASVAYAAPDATPDGAHDAALVDGSTADTSDAAAADGATSAKTVAGKLAEVNAENPGELISLLISAFKKGEIAWGLALCFMLLTYFLRKVLLKWIPKKVLPWVAISLAMGVNVAASFSTGLSWYAALGSGLTMGLAAVGGWEAIGKLFKKSPAENAKEDAASESPQSNTAPSEANDEPSES